MHRFVCLALVLCGCAAAARAQESDAEKPAGKLITPAADRSIERGLKWLAAQQHEEGDFGAGQSRGNVAVCAWQAWR